MLDHFFRDGGVSVALIAAVALLLQRKNRVSWLHIAGVCLLTLSMSAVFQLAGLTPMSGGLRIAVRLEDVNLIPFLSVFGIIQTSVTNGEPIFAVTNLLGNIAMFIPLGLLLPLLWKRCRRLWKTMLAAFAVSFGIEFVQLFLTRGTDIDDILLNVVGAMVGYGLFRILRRLAKRFTVQCMLPRAQRRTLWRMIPYACVLVPFAVTFLFGFVDQAAYADAPAAAAIAEAQPGETAGLTDTDGAAAGAQTDAQPGQGQANVDLAGHALQAPSDGTPVEENIGMIVFNDLAGMRVTGNRLTPPKAVTPSQEDVQMLAGLFFGRTLSNQTPACDGDIVIETADCILVVDTLCGAVAATTAELTGATRLEEEDLALLCEVLAHYDLPLNRASGTEKAQ